MLRLLLLLLWRWWLLLHVRRCCTVVLLLRRRLVVRVRGVLRVHEVLPRRTGLLLARVLVRDSAGDLPAREHIGVAARGRVLVQAQARDAAHVHGVRDLSLIHI